MIFTRDRRARNYICSQSGKGLWWGWGRERKGGLKGCCYLSASHKVRLQQQQCRNPSQILRESHACRKPHWFVQLHSFQTQHHPQTAIIILWLNSQHNRLLETVKHSSIMNKVFKEEPTIIPSSADSHKKMCVSFFFNLSSLASQEVIDNCQL